MSAATIFGREPLLRQLERTLGRGQDALLLAGPRMGKSAMLAALAKRLNNRCKRGHQKEMPFGCALIELGGHGERDSESLPKKILAAVQDMLGELSLGPKVPRLNKTPVFSRNPKPGDQSDWRTLRTAIEELWTELRGRGGWCRYVLLIDGAETLPSAARCHDIAPLCKWRDGDASPLALLLAGGRRLHDHKLDELSYLHKSFYQTHLTALGEEEVSKWLKSTVGAIDRRHRSAVYRATGGHPFLVDTMLLNLQRMGATALEWAIEDTANATTDFFSEVLANLSGHTESNGQGANKAPSLALFDYILACGARGCQLTDAERKLRCGSLRNEALRLEYNGLIAAARSADGMRVLKTQCELWNRWYGQPA